MFYRTDPTIKTEPLMQAESLEDDATKKRQGKPKFRVWKKIKNFFKMSSLREIVLDQDFRKVFTM